MTMNQNIPTILVADDEAINVQLAVKPLRKEGYRVLTAYDGRQALALLSSEPVDLALLDVMMPHMTGFEVCRALREDPKTAKIPVLFVTGRTDTASILEGFDAGGVDYLGKPWHPAEFLARVNTHLRLRKAEQEARALNASKDKFISIIAHELKAPFTSLKGILKMLVEDFQHLDAKQFHDYLRLSYESADHLHGLIKNLLTWSTLQQGMEPYLPEELDLGVSVFEHIESFREAAFHKQIQLTSDIPEGTFVRADVHMLQTVLHNLIANALMFTPEGGRVNLSVQRDEKEDRWLRVSVSDTGIGIAQEDQDKLFRMDAQLRRRGTAGEMGTGMGLILCRELIEKHGGRIWLESKEGAGTTVFFTLPRGNSDLERVRDSDG